MSVLLGFVVGVLAVRLLVGAGHDLLRAPALERANRRGRTVPTAMGVLAVLAVVVVEAGRSLLEAFGVGNAPGAAARSLVLLACVGFGCSACSTISPARTIGPRLPRPSWRCSPTGASRPGLVKIVGGGALPSSSSAWRAGAGVVSGGRSGEVVSDALLVALAANLTNLFDRAPGRAIKVGLLAWLPIAPRRADSVGVAVAPVVGVRRFARRRPARAPDARRRRLERDRRVLGLAVVLECSPGTRTVVLAGARRVHARKRAVSRSAASSNGCPLRRLDELGRGA